MAFKECVYCGSLMHSSADCRHPSKAETMVKLYGGSPTGRLSSNKPAVQCVPGTPTVALEMAAIKGDPYKHVKYKCTVSPTDQLVSYVTDLEHPPRDEFVLVMTNAQGEKISVILSRVDAIHLQNHLNDFIINGKG